MSWVEDGGMVAVVRDCGQQVALDQGQKGKPPCQDCFRLPNLSNKLSSGSLLPEITAITGGYLITTTIAQTLLYFGSCRLQVAVFQLFVDLELWLCYAVESLTLTDRVLECLRLLRTRTTTASHPHFLSSSLCIESFSPYHTYCTALQSSSMPTYMTRHYYVPFLGQQHHPLFHQLAKSTQNSKSKRRPVAVSPQNSNVPAKALALFQSGAGGNWKLRKLTTTSPPAILLHHQRLDILKSLCIACLEDRDAQLNTSQPPCHGRCKKRAVSTRPEHKPETLSWKP